MLNFRKKSRAKTYINFLIACKLGYYNFDFVKVAL